jgi:septum formation protein
MYHKDLTNICNYSNVSWWLLILQLIAEYVASGEPMDKAGGYGYQGTARCFVERIDGDYWNVVGFPSCAFAKRASPLLVELARRAMEDQK